MDEDEEDEEGEWHLNVEEDGIQNTININMNKIKDGIDVEKIVKEW
jgi:subtilisin-like proprotein convertase family protein